MTRPKLLICTPSAALRGGVERIIESLALGLPKRGIDVVVGLAKGERFHRPDLYRREYPQLDFAEIDGTAGTRQGRLRGLRRTLDEVQPDIVLITRLFDAYQAVCERKVCGDPVRLGVTIQSYEPDYIAELATYRNFVDFCVTSGNLIAGAVEHLDEMPADSVASIPGGVAPPRRHVRRADGGAPLRLGYVGRLEQQQKRILDLPDLLLALRAKGIPFTCAVAGSGSDEQELRGRLARAGLDGSVHFHGWLSGDELYDRIYPELEVFIHFAEWEGITIAPREAMAHGTVPVVSDFRGRAEEEIFRDGETALVFPVGDTARAAQHVARLWSDREEWERLSRAATSSQGGVRSAEGALDRWAEVLRASLARPQRKGRSIPDFDWPPSGRLDRMLGPSAAETVRQLLRRQFLHANPGGEWPHSSGLVDPELIRKVEAFRADQSSEGLPPGKGAGG